MSVTSTPPIAGTHADTAERRSQETSQTIMAFGASVILHTVILAVMAAITWVVVHETDRQVVLEFGGGGGGGGSPGGGRGAAVGGSGSTAGQEAQPNDALAALQLPAAPAPPANTFTDVASVNEPAPTASNMAIAGNTDPALSAFGVSMGGGVGVGTGRGSGSGSGIGPGDGSGTGGGSGSGNGPGIGAGVGPGLNGLAGDMRRRGLDVVFVLDATDSMSPYIGQSKERLREVMSVVTNLLTDAGSTQPRKDLVRFGLIAFKDYGDEYGIEAVKGISLNTEITPLQKFLDDVTAGGGADTPEPLHDALRAATAKKMGWSKQRKNVIVLVTDAPCHSLGRDLASREAQQFVKAMDGQINVIDVGGVADGKRMREAVLPDLANISKAGSGSAFLLEDEKSFWRHLIGSIFGQRYDQDIDQIINRYAKPSNK